MSLNEIVQLSNKNGARVLSNLSDFINDQKIRTIIYDDTQTEFDEKTAKNLYDVKKINCVSKSWLLDSLACYSIRDMKEYQSYIKNT